MDAQIKPGAFLLGDTLTVLDRYVATVSRWAPRRSRFYREVPRMAQIVRRVDSDTRLTSFWSAFRHTLEDLGSGLGATDPVVYFTTFALLVNSQPHTQTAVCSQPA